jgi:uncharacterized membrane protein
MSIFTWARDLFGIGLDRKLKKKVELETEKLESEKLEKLIEPANQKDVEKYDSKTKKLVDRIEGTRTRTTPNMTPFLLPLSFFIIVISLLIQFLSTLGGTNKWVLLLYFLLILLLCFLVILIINLVKRKRVRNQHSKKDKHDS